MGNVAICDMEQLQPMDAWHATSLAFPITSPQQAASDPTLRLDPVVPASESKVVGGRKQLSPIRVLKGIR